MVDSIKKHLIIELSDVIYNKINQANQFKDPRAVANSIAFNIINAVELVDETIQINSLDKLQIKASIKDMWELCCTYLIKAKCIEEIEATLDFNFAEELKDYQSETQCSILEFKKVQ